MTPARRRFPRYRHRSRRRRPDILRAAAVLALIGVAACSGIATDVNPTPTVTPAAAAATAAATQAAATTLAPPAVPTETAMAVPTPAPERRYPEPASLAGLDEGQLSGLLGQPRFKRRDDPAQIWQYRNDACALDVFLYKTGKDGPFTVLHFETRGRDKKPVDQKDCFVSLLKDRDRGRAGGRAG
ncbi:MAG: hypothetical protein HYZ04_03675 [Rhodospirillales bacterium]|nr:hypothetical protein [Rhodospirillales bacterium]